MSKRIVSPTTASAAAGALFVGLATALVFALALGPMGGFPFGLPEIALAFLMGAVFGTIAGGVAGASEVSAVAAEVDDVIPAPVVRGHSPREMPT